jgi:hypothetical protein
MRQPIVPIRPAAAVGAEEGMAVEAVVAAAITEGAEVGTAVEATEAEVTTAERPISKPAGSGGQPAQVLRQHALAAG